MVGGGNRYAIDLSRLLCKNQSALMEVEKDTLLWNIYKDEYKNSDDDNKRAVKLDESIEVGSDFQRKSCSLLFPLIIECHGFLYL